MASPLVGEGEINDLIIFNVNHVELDDKSICAVVYALDKTTGEEVWNQPLDVDSKSSPIGLYQRDGKSYIVMGDDGGTLRLMDGLAERPSARSIWAARFRLPRRLTAMRLSSARRAACCILLN